MKVLVLGGKGFIGRHAVQALKRSGATVTVGTRRVASGGDPAAEEQYVLHKAVSVDDWLAPAQRYDVILNCVGILRQRIAESYDAIHHLAPRAIATACAGASTRFVHVSALGLSINARSRFLTSKARGELAIQESGDDWYIARISLIDGERGYGAKWLRGVSRLPIFIVPSSAHGHIAPLTAVDAGEALCNLCLHDQGRLDTEISRVYEFGGETNVSFEDYIHGLGRRYRSQRALSVRVPGTITRLGAHICDVLHFSPFSFGHWELLCRDNVPAPNRLRDVLGRAPETLM